jgi:signal transduction histidine kinase
MTKTAQSIANFKFDRKVEVTTDDEIGELGESINRMSAQLEAYILELKDANEKLARDIADKNKIDAMRKEFIASASHELKTPLSLIMGYAEALNLSDLSEDAKKEYIDTIIDESNKMNRLVMKLLKISQFESGFEDVSLEPVPLLETVQGIVRSFDILFGEKDVDLSINVRSMDVMADKDALSTILENYVQNALQHIGGERKINIRADEKDDAYVKISVHNTGPHIPEEDMSMIWDSFYKVDKARTRAYGGQGLGLHIVKMHAEAMHAEYGCETVNDGVIFYLILKKA